MSTILPNPYPQSGRIPVYFNGAWRMKDYVSGSGASSSPDLVSWTNYAPTGTGAFGGISNTNFVYGGNLLNFYPSGASTTDLYSSPDGVAFTKTTNYLGSIALNGTIYVVGSNLYCMMTNTSIAGFYFGTSLTSWTAKTPNVPGLYIVPVVAGTALWSIQSGTSSPAVYNCTDLNNWIYLGTLTTPVGYKCVSACYEGGTVYAVVIPNSGTGGLLIYHTVDGAAWSLITMTNAPSITYSSPFSVVLSSVLYLLGVYQSSTGSTDAIWSVPLSAYPSITKRTL